jgi:hypothetical protein
VIQGTVLRLSDCLLVSLAFEWFLCPRRLPGRALYSSALVHCAASLRSLSIHPRYPLNERIVHGTHEAGRSLEPHTVETLIPPEGLNELVGTKHQLEQSIDR